MFFTRAEAIIVALCRHADICYRSRTLGRAARAEISRPRSPMRKSGEARRLGFGKSRLRAALWINLALLLPIASIAGRDGHVSAQTSSADHEPITPIPQPPAADPRKVALGKRLFQDTRLSHDETRSCVSCHDTNTNGADAKDHDLTPAGAKLPFNTLTVFNAALSFRLGWEGRVRTLQAQAEGSLAAPGIMGSSVAEVLDRLRADQDTVRRFQDAYRQPPDRENLLDAITVYEQSLVTPGSRFDRWLGGDAAALSAEEKNGYQLFKTVGCVSCHQGVNVGGNLFERHGIFHPLASPKPEILRVPSLRNVATTPPYFQDGSSSSLDDAVRSMGRAQLNVMVTDAQVQAIIAFLRTLTGNYHGHLVVGAPR